MSETTTGSLYLWLREVLLAQEIGWSLCQYTEQFPADF
jgi:hypothetical protein